jgi:hypothetical protein
MCPGFSGVGLLDDQPSSDHRRTRPCRRVIRPEFRRRVIELVESGRPVALVAADLGISEQTIFRHRRGDGGLSVGLAVEAWFGEVSRLLRQGDRFLDAQPGRAAGGAVRWMCCGPRRRFTMHPHDSGPFLASVCGDHHVADAPFTERNDADTVAKARIWWGGSVVCPAEGTLTGPDSVSKCLADPGLHHGAAGPIFCRPWSAAILSTALIACMLGLRGRRVAPGAVSDCRVGLPCRPGGHLRTWSCRT